MMDAGLETIGARCASCNKQDFLPFKCSHCALSFCIDHAQQYAHACHALNVKKPSPAVKTSTGPSLKALQAEHLARRRISPQPQTQAKVQAKQEAADRIKGALSSLQSRFSLPKSAAAVRTADEARKIGALKREAKGDAKVPISQRRYLFVKGTGAVQSRFVSTEWSCGRMLDELAKALGMENENARTSLEERRLHILLQDEDLVLEPSQLVGSRLKRDGLTVCVYRGNRPISS